MLGVKFSFKLVIHEFIKFVLFVVSDMLVTDVPELEIQKLLDRDPYLTDHQQEITRRFSVFQDLVKDINSREGGVEQFALGHKKFGPQVSAANN